MDIFSQIYREGLVAGLLIGSIIGAIIGCLWAIWSQNRLGRKLGLIAEE